jgi:hypothetical protein
MFDVQSENNLPQSGNRLLSNKKVQLNAEIHTNESVQKIKNMEIKRTIKRLSDDKKKDVL